MRACQDAREHSRGRRFKSDIRLPEVMGSNPISDTGVDLSLDFTHVKPLSQISEHVLNMPRICLQASHYWCCRAESHIQQNLSSSHHPPSVCVCEQSVVLTDDWQPSSDDCCHIGLLFPKGDRSPPLN